MNQIDFKNDEINKQMGDILINEGVQQKIEIFCQKNIIENSNTFKVIPLLKTNKNIMLLSKSGNGKSTLTNSLCDLDDDKKAKTSDSQPCTMENTFYEGKNKDLKFNIIDTRGFEEETYSENFNGKYY
jgi:septin family protein